jgi:hypothetical protein
MGVMVCVTLVGICVALIQVDCTFHLHYGVAQIRQLDTAGVGESVNVVDDVDGPCEDVDGLVNGPCEGVAEGGRGSLSTLILILRFTFLLMHHRFRKD